MSSDDEKSLPSILEPESTGGDHARRGFHFQHEVALSYLPKWLSYEGFMGMGSELIGDIEARFFVPGIGTVIECIEAKNHHITPSEFWNEIDRFKRLHVEAPGTYRWFTLVSTGLSSGLQPLRNTLRRLKEAYAFYDQGTAILDHSYSEYEKQVLGHQDRTPEDARFLFDMVLLEPDFTNSAFGGSNFFGSISEYLPICREIDLSQLESVASRLRVLLGDSERLNLTRLDIEGCFNLGSGAGVVLSSRSVVVAIAEQARVSLHNVIEFDWEAFFSGDDRSYPPIEEWGRIVKELEETRDWIINERQTKRVMVRGNHRLPVFFAFGACLPAVGGFTLEYENRDGIWKTEDYPDDSTPTYDWERKLTVSTTSEEIAVSIGLGLKIEDSVDLDLSSRGLGEIPSLHLFGQAPVSSAQQLNLAIDNAKKDIREAVVETNAKLIHLYIAGPAQFAMFLGHRFKAINPVQLYVWGNQGKYYPVFRLPA